jgi:hypothetical protein
MPLPSWLTPGDPYAARRMRQLVAIAAAEQQVRAGVDAAIAEFLALARAGVLGDATPGALVAAADDVPPDLSGGWPTLAQWADMLRRLVLPPVGLVFGERFAAESARALIAVQPYVDRYIEKVFDRLVIWPAGAFEDVRAELQEGLNDGDDVRRLRDRIGAVLNADAPSRPIQAEINALTREIEDDETTPGRRKAARAERAALYRDLDDADKRWQWKAARVARTETLGAFNGGTYMGAAAVELATGETRYKQWWSTSDDRVRASHWAAHMQVTELHDHFSVGGYLLDHPGDPTAPGHETINCRCTILILNAAEAEAERARYESLRPGRTNRRGELIDDDGNPIGPPQLHQGFTPLDLTADAAVMGDDMPTRPLLAATTPADDEPVPDAPEPGALPVGFRGRIAPLDQVSGDGRVIAAPTGEPRVRPLPIAFKWQDAATFGHDNAVVVGAITRVWADAGYLWASGPLDVDDPEGAEFTRKLRDGFTGHVSVDLDDVTSEYRIMAPDGTLVDPDDVEALLVDDGDGWYTLPEGYREVEIAADWRLMSTTGVADPAFPEARVFPVYDLAELVPVADLVAEREREANAGASQDDVALVAGAAPLAAPVSWFDRPQLDGPTPLTITDDGRVFGHAALFDSCHVGFAGRCVPAPRGADYGRFHLKAYRTADGGDIAVGALVMGTDHASTSPSTSVAAAMAHYADNGKCAAYVRAGDDEYGVWVSGVLDPGLSEVEQVRVRAMTLSGDWRTMNGRVSFIAALAVNVPGFAVPRKTTGDQGQLVALVAAGALHPVPDTAGQRRTARRQATGGQVRVVVPEPREFAREVLAAMREQQATEDAAAALDQRVRAGAVQQLAARVHAGRQQRTVAALAARVHGSRG